VREAVISPAKDHIETNFNLDLGAESSPNIQNKNKLGPDSFDPSQIKTRRLQDVPTKTEMFSRYYVESNE
jgi:hypothetical protein